MSRTILWGIIVFFGLWGWFLSPVAQAQTCAGGNGECKSINACNASGGAIVSDDTCIGLICCIGGVGGPLPPVVPCTSVDSGNAGVCRSTCQGSEVPESSGGTCGGGYCCVTYGTGTGNACTDGGGRCARLDDGCDTRTEQQASRSGCGNTQICCDPKGGSGGPGSGGSGGPGSGGGTTGSCPTGYTKISGVCFPGGTGLSDKSVLQILTTLISWLLAIFGFIAILGFIISGLQYLTSAGDEGRAETAKRNMQYAIIGVIVALSGWVIIQAVDTLLKADPKI